MIGPFSISENSSRFQKTLKVEISENNGRYSAKEVEVVNRNGEKITGFNYDGSNIYNGEFYIKLDKETIKAKEYLEQNA